MLENAVYSVLSPEGFASILWKDASRSGEACTMMKLTAQDLYSGWHCGRDHPGTAGRRTARPRQLFLAGWILLCGCTLKLVQDERQGIGRPALQKIPPYRRNEERMKGLQLLATGGALPGRVVTNED